MHYSNIASLLFYLVFPSGMPDDKKVGNMKNKEKCWEGNKKT